MGLIDDASLAFTAALGASKPGTAYSLKPTDGSGDFAFTRADDPNDGGLDLAATFVNEQGYIEKGYENFLRQSNNFDTSPWEIQFGSHTLTSGQLGYDGTNDAWLTQKESSVNHWIQQSVSVSGINTFSIYAKNNTTNGAGGILINSVLGGAIFNLENGTVYIQSGINASIEPISNDWYRCSFTFNGSSSLLRFQVVSALGSDDVIGKSIYIQDAMLNEGLVAMPYIESGATKAQNGLAPDEPRFTFSNGTRSLLLEPERTNLNLHSQYISLYQVTAEYNQIVSPDGYKNALLIKENTALNTHGSNVGNWFPQNNNAENYTISVFAKPKERKHLQFQFYVDGAAYNSSMFFLETAYTEGDPSTHKIEPYADGWYRYSFTASLANTSGGYHFARFIMGISSVSAYYQGDGNSGMYLYGLQLEKGSYPTSLIPTYGTTKTRFLDDLTSALLPVDGLFGPTAGTIFLEFANPLENVSNNWFFVTSLLADGRYMRVRNYWQFNFTNLTFDPSPNLSRTDGATKIAVKWGDGVVKVFTDHRSPESATYTGGDINLNGHLSNLNGDFGFYKNNANFKKIMFFRTALSDDECIELTTL